MTPTEFEILTQKLLTERLRKEFKNEILVEHQKAFTSSAGNKYQIDVSYSFNLFDISYLTLVECKCWNSYVTKEKIGYFKSIIDDLKAHRGIVFTTKGFQSGAIKLAKSQNIGLIKITNDYSFETFSNADGKLALIEEILEKNEVSFNSKNKYTSIGIFTPTNNIIEYISSKYGRDFASFLKNDFSIDMLDKTDLNIKTSVKNQLLKIPENWCVNYKRLETAGLNYKIKNELELRQINQIIAILKYTL